MKRAVICFTRVPVPGKTKTRLMPLLGGKNCARLHTAFLQDLAILVNTDSGTGTWTPTSLSPMRLSRTGSRCGKSSPLQKLFWSSRGRTLASGWTTPSAGCLRGGMRPVC